MKSADSLSSANMISTSIPAKPRRTTLTALGGLIGGLVFGVLPIPDWLAPGNSMPAMLAREAIVWCLALAILLWVTLVENAPLSSIGFRPPTWKSALVGVVGAIWFMGIMCIPIVLNLVRHGSPGVAVPQPQAILNTPFWFRLLLVLRAAVTKEVLFRGYLIEKVRLLSGSMGAALFVSIFASTFAYPRDWGGGHINAFAASGYVFGFLYVWRRDLPANMLAHFLTNAACFITCALGYSLSL